MKLLLLLFLLQQDPLDLTNVVSADVQRKAIGQDVRVIITVNLMGGVKFTTDFFISPDDIAIFKSGTNPQKAAIRKKYIRQAVKNYRASQPPPAEVDGGSATVPKAAFSDPGDTNP